MASSDMNKNTQTHKTFCRFCHVFCGMEVDVVDGKIVDLRGDKDNAISKGYTCIKGRAEVERIYHNDRLTSCQKRTDATLKPIDKSAALDEISSKLKAIIDKHGPNSVAVYTGCAGHRASAGGPWMVGNWLKSIGSRGNYTSYTIDSPALSVVIERMYGDVLPFTAPDLQNSEVAMFVGTSPTSSHQLTMEQSNPSTRMKDAQKSGMKLVVIDPRRSAVAKRADVHLQVKPGEDASLLAAMIKVIISNNWYDEEYVEAYCSGFEDLKAAVEPFTLEYAERRSQVPKELIVEGARIFATAKTGAAQTGTGLHMAAHQNVATQLVYTFNALCGRIDREGGLVRAQGVLTPALPDKMQPLGMHIFTNEVARVRNIRGINGLFAGHEEMPTSTLVDEILKPGEGQIKALIVNGGNPALVFSDTERTVEALKSLDLLVCLELFESATAKYADYIMTVKHPFERSDIAHLMDPFYPEPFMQFSHSLVEPPEGCIEEGEFFWETAKRLDLDLGLPGVAGDSDYQPMKLMQALNPHSQVPIEEIAKHPSGKIFVEKKTVIGSIIPDMIGHADKRIAIGHPDAMKELAAVYAEPIQPAGGYEGESDYRFRAITYRMPEVYCTTGQNLPKLLGKRPYNPILIHPKDLEELGFANNERVMLEGRNGRVEAILEISDDVGRGTVAIAFGWGDPADNRDIEEKGSNIQALIPFDKYYDPITGLAQQSAYPVNIVKHKGVIASAH